MKLIITIMMLLGLLATSLAVPGALPGSVTRSVNSLPYEIVPMTFTGTLGGHEVQFNGSIEEIHEQMKSVHPEFDPDALLEARNLTKKFELESDLVPRWGGKLLPPWCCPQNSEGEWRWTSDDTIGVGVKYLDNFHGLCGVGGRSCVRISCSWNAAIFLCNDNEYGITPACPYMASYATDIMTDCFDIEWDGRGNELRYTCGQLKDSDNYNIIVREDWC